MTTLEAVDVNESTTITLSDEAVAKALELLREEDGAMALRVAVKPGGCSGLSYDLFFDHETHDDDTRLNFGELLVVVDADSADLLKGAVLDYKDGLQDAGFHISNPNAERTCGCGNSFC
jgi:iron-sulfur cluster assembly accessory protein